MRLQDLNGKLHTRFCNICECVLCIWIRIYEELQNKTTKTFCFFLKVFISPISIKLPRRNYFLSFGEFSRLPLVTLRSIFFHHGYFHKLSALPSVSSFCLWRFVFTFTFHLKLYVIFHKLLSSPLSSLSIFIPHGYFHLPFINSPICVQFLLLARDVQRLFFSSKRLNACYTKRYTTFSKHFVAFPIWVFSWHHILGLSYLLVNKNGDRRAIWGMGFDGLFLILLFYTCIFLCSLSFTPKGTFQILR